MASTATLTDDFATGVDITTKWTGPLNPPYVTWDADRKAARLMCYSGGSQLVAQHAAFYDLTGSYSYARMSFTYYLGNEITYTLFGFTVSGNNYFRMGPRTSFTSTPNHNFQITRADNNTITTLLDVPYNETAHGGWWRIREAAGTVYFERSPDGMTWTTLATTATPAWANQVYPWFSATNPFTYNPLTYLYIDNVNVPPGTEPWVLMTGPKGATGTSSFPALEAGGGAFNQSAPYPPPVQPVRRWCQFWNSPQAIRDAGGLGWSYNYDNYTGRASGVSGQQHCRMQMIRSPNGRVTYQGLGYAFGAPNDGYAFYLPWDGIPLGGQRVCSVADLNGQRARFDFMNDPTYGWNCLLDSSAVALGSGIWFGIQVSFQSNVPVGWVDYGLKVRAAAGVLPQTVDYTVQGGQVSGFLGGKPYTVTLPAQKVTLSYPVYGANTNAAFTFYYDVVNQTFAHFVSSASVYSANFELTGLSGWMSLAEAGQIVLATWNIMYSTGVFDNLNSNVRDHRFLMVGPNDMGQDMP